MICLHSHKIKCLKSHVLSSNSNSDTMGLQNEETATRNGVQVETTRRRRRRRRWSTSSVSFSAKLPEDVAHAFHEYCICAVKYSSNPFREIRESILQVVENVGIQDWKQMVELVHCYLALNSADIHCFIQEAFLSLRFNFPRS